MAPTLTETEFSQHLNTKYRVNVDAPKLIELELVEVKSYVNKDKPGEQGGMERFSIYFRGPADNFLPQGMYHMTHERMGDFDLFLVPIARQELGFRYEAVFNYHTNK
jgi:L-ascorbate metabolism protein UlaG (beta-lactamase superfamily)